MVTVEAALVFPTMLFLAACALWGFSAVLAQLRCSAAAAAAAVAAGSGAAPLEVRAVAARDAPPGASVAVSTAGRLVTVSVGFAARPPEGLLRLLPPIRVVASQTVYSGGTVTGTRR